MSKKEVLFRIDNDSEMLEVVIDGVVWLSGNFWDFDFIRDAPSLLDKLGINNSEEYYSDGDEE